MKIGVRIIANLRDTNAARAYHSGGGQIHRIVTIIGAVGNPRPTQLLPSVTVMNQAEPVPDAINPTQARALAAI